MSFFNPFSKISDMILRSSKTRLTDKQFLEKEIAKWKNSPQRMAQIKGFLYCDGDHDILKRKRMVIGEKGELEEVKNLPNNRIVDNRYGGLVAQKTNYLMGKPLTFDSDNKQYAELLKKALGKRFMRTLKRAGKAMLNGGIAWLYPYCNDLGKLDFRLFPAYEILPFWKDSEHTILDMAVRLYQVSGYEGTVSIIIEKVEVYTLDGVQKFILKNGTLEPDTEYGKLNENCPVGSPTGFFYAQTTTSDGKICGLNWSKIPLIALKYNESEIPLLNKVKTLQDGLNVMLSDFENNMQEDAHNTVLVLKNYDGEELGKFRQNLAIYNAVKVCCDGDSNGGVETLQIQVNSENYKAIIELFKKAIIENGMGYDAKDDRLSGNPNQMNIQSMYSDIDLDANDMETELQASFEEILWFVNAYLANTGQGDFEDAEVNVIFNRDILINETESIANCAASVGILSDETIIGQHPWIDDPQLEIERLKQQEKQQNYDPFGESNEEQRVLEKPL